MGCFCFLFVPAQLFKVSRRGWLAGLSEGRGVVLVVGLSSGWLVAALCVGGKMVDMLLKGRRLIRLVLEG
ncbi:unnamed protein product [Periconia digitata]|uniref:Transmembrane protein n=1 Tax=Periconia digitata TaxID=1303443 RepID=A0A9W4XWA3_9PLEO|nr:unnamed protein product [Periconia digitata]